MNTKLSITSQILIPVLTCIVGAVAANWWSARNIAIQEMALAFQIMSSESRSRVTGAEEWASRVVSRYKEELSQPDISLYAAGLSRETRESICIFPKAGFREKPRFFLDSSTDDELVKKDSRTLLIQSVAQYRELERHYDLMTSLLRSSCGFLDRPPATTAPKEH